MKLTLLIFIIICNNVFLRVEGNPPPNIGDVKLVPYNDHEHLYEAQVFFTDRIEKPRWGAICGDSVNNNLGMAICRQVGRTFSGVESRATNTPVWLKTVTCNAESLHLLHCKYTIVSGADMSNPNVCGPNGHRVIVQCNPEDNNYPRYDGQVKLCPSDSQIKNDSDSNTFSSISHGVVSLFYDHAWRGINLQGSSKSSFGGYEADAICRQMGFTHAVSDSIIARNSSGYTFNDCYDSTTRPHTLQDKAWMYANKSKCQGDVQQKCYGCCYNFQSAVFKTGCPTCDSSYDLVLSCSYDPVRAGLPQIGSSGNENDCKLTGNSNKKVARCHSDRGLKSNGYIATHCFKTERTQSHCNILKATFNYQEEKRTFSRRKCLCTSTLKDYKIAVALLALGIIIIIILLVINGICCYKKFRKRRDTKSGDTETEGLVTVNSVKDDSKQT